MSESKNPILFDFKSTFIIITLISALILSNSCNFAPKKYADTIRTYAGEYCLDPALIFSICEVESHFNPQAVSEKGAIGIMQIMPQTGEWIASSLGIKGFQKDDLLKAKINIRFGCWYLSYLMTCFSEYWQWIAAYNAGEGTVRGWLDAGIDKADLIPISETASYVKSVENAISRYHRKKYAAFD